MPGTNEERPENVSAESSHTSLEAGEDVSPIDRWEIPESWTWTTVGSVAEVKAGMSRNPRNRASSNATKYIRAANITESGLNLNDLYEMDFDTNKRELFQLRRGDIVLSEASGSPEQVGKPAIWNDEIPVCCFQNTVIRFRSMGVSSDFALTVFRHYFVNGLFAKMVRGVGIGHIGSERFAMCPFPLPPRKEQDRIVSEFAVHSRSVKTALESLQSAKDKMTFQRKAVIRAAIGPNSTREVPVGWLRVRIGDICEAVNGRSFKKVEWSEDGLPIIRIQNLRNRDAHLNYFAGEVEDRHIVYDGDLLFAWSGTPGTSFGAFLWEGPCGALNQHIFKITADESRVSNEFLYHAINQNLDSYVKSAQGGSGLAHLTRAQFLESEVVLAPLREQDRIVKSIRENLATIAQQELIIDQSIQKARSLQQSLLVQAVGGKLVKQLDCDESSLGHLADVRKELDRYKQGLEQKKKALKGVGKPQKLSPMTAVKRNIQEVLVESGPLTVQELLRMAGYAEEKPGEVETFYRLLDKAVKSKQILLEIGGDPESTKLKAVTA